MPGSHIGDFDRWPYIIEGRDPEIMSFITRNNRGYAKVNFNEMKRAKWYILGDWIYEMMMKICQHKI